MKAKYRLILVGTAFYFFVLGDLITTLIGLSVSPKIYESNPVIASIIQGNPILILVPIKLLVFGLFYGGYKIVPKPHNLGIMIGLSLLGLGITTYNLTILLKI